MKFLTYTPEQAYLLPPSVGEVLGEDHVCFFVHRAVERLDLGAFEQGYVEEGRPAYHPALLLKVWLYAYALGVTSARRPRLAGAGAGGLGLPVPGRGSHAGFLDPEPVSDAARPRAERSVHAGGGVGALAGDGAAGARGPWLGGGRGPCPA